MGTPRVGAEPSWAALLLLLPAARLIVMVTLSQQCQQPGWASYIWHILRKATLGASALDLQTALQVGYCREHIQMQNRSSQRDWSLWDGTHRATSAGAGASGKPHTDQGHMVHGENFTIGCRKR
jgi:hypothetical protein